MTQNASAQTVTQFYVLCDSDFFIESRTDFVCTLDTLSNVLADPGFMDRFDHRFDLGAIHRFDIEPCNKAPGAKKVAIHYTDQFGDQETTDFFLLPVRIFS